MTAKAVSNPADAPRMIFGFDRTTNVQKTKLVTAVPTPMTKKVFKRSVMKSDCQCNLDNTISPPRLMAAIVMTSVKTNR